MATFGDMFKGYSPNYGGQITMPGWAQGALSAAGMAPGWAGIGASLANMGIHGYNTAMSANQASRVGAEGPGPLGFLGGIFGFNNRGDTQGNATIAAPGQWTDPLNREQPAITQQGMYDQSPFGFIARMFGSMFDPTGARTPGEAMRRNAMVGNILRLGPNNGQIGGSSLGGNPNAIRGNTFAGDKPFAGAEFDVVSGTWSTPGNAGGASNNSGTQGGGGNFGGVPSGFRM